MIDTSSQKFINKNTFLLFIPIYLHVFLFKPLDMLFMNLFVVFLSTLNFQLTNSSNFLQVNFGIRYKQQHNKEMIAT